MARIANIVTCCLCDVELPTTKATAFAYGPEEIAALKAAGLPTKRYYCKDRKACEATMNEIRAQATLPTFDVYFNFKGYERRVVTDVPAPSQEEANRMVNEDGYGVERSKFVESQGDLCPHCGRNMAKGELHKDDCESALEQDREDGLLDEYCVDCEKEKDPTKFCPLHSENETQYRNHYLCPGNNPGRIQHLAQSWAMVWSSMCNDRCPTCNVETQPSRSEEL
jgi:hypothetical protein